jgi:predicted DNA-binding helix-hairpin-helix protein
MREHRLYQADWLMRFYGCARMPAIPFPSTRKSTISSAS